MALILSVGLACMGTTQTPTPQPQLPQPTPQPQLPQPTPEPQLPEPTQEQLQPTPEQPQTTDALDFFTEEFEGDVSNWTYFITKNDSGADDSGVEPGVDNGYLVLDLNQYLNVYVMYDPYSYENVRIDARVENRGTNNNNINMVCRYSDEGWYEIAVANNGLYWLYAYDGVKGVYVKLADGGSNKIRSGKEVNDYTFVCNDRNLIFYINGVETRKYTDNQYVFRDGQIGVGASSFRDMPVTVEFDWVQISLP